MNNNLFTTFLYYYSAVAQSMAALFTVSGVFAIFKIQAMDDQLKKTFEAYKESVRRRFLILLHTMELSRNSNNERKINEVKVEMGEIDEWLDKDVMANLLSDFQKAKKKFPEALQPAMADYFDSMNIRIERKKYLIISLNKPLKLSAATFVFSIIALLIISLLNNSIVQYLIAGILLLLIFYTVYSIIIYIFNAMDDPKDKVFNNKLLGEFKEREDIIKEIEGRMFQKINEISGHTP